MGEPSSITSYCAHCERQVPSANFDLHAVHCKRNLERCNLCGEMVAKSRAEEHYDDVHAPVKCSLCEEAIDRELFMLHQNEKCAQRMVACSFCEFPIAAIDLDAHADQCGNRTEMCTPCNKYIRLREKIAHDLHFHSLPQDDIGTSSRTHPIHPHRDRGHGTPSKSKLLVTVAITGIAIIIGTFVLQRRSQS